MRRLILLLFIAINYISASQILSVYSPDTSSFPVVRASFLAFDSQRKQLLNLSASDFTVTEDGVPRKVLSVGCPQPKPPDALSSVIVIDCSGSMEVNGINIAKTAAETWFDYLPTDVSDCAVTSFNVMNYLLQDFTGDKVLLHRAIEYLLPDGDTYYDAALLDPHAGAIPVASRGTHKRIVIFLSDGYPNIIPQTERIIAEAKDKNIIIYSVILGMDCPDCMKDISSQTGGKWYEQINTAEEAKAVYMDILATAQNTGRCTIEWESGNSCSDSPVNAEIAIPAHSLRTNTGYQKPESAINRLELTPPFIAFGNIAPGTTKDTTITITARNSDYTINSITGTNSNFTVKPSSFTLSKDQSTTITVSFKPDSSMYSYTEFTIESVPCETRFSAVGYYSNGKRNDLSLKLTCPNGGEEFVTGTDTAVTWVGVMPEDTVILEYSTNAGRTWNRITDTAYGLKYIWKNVPDSVSKTCLMRIWLKNYPQAQERRSTILNRFYGHKDKITSIRWNTTGTKIATSSWDKSIIIWNSNYYSPILTLKGHKDYVNDLSWSPDGAKIVSCSADSSLMIWDTKSGAIITKIDKTGSAVTSVSWSHDGKTIAGGGTDGSVKIWDAATGNLLKTLTKHRLKVNSVCWSPKGDRLATGGSDPHVMIWDAASGNVLDSLPTDNIGVNKIDWSPDGTMIGLASEFNLVMIYDGNSYKFVKYLDKFAYDIRWSRDSKRVLMGKRYGEIAVTEVSTGNSLFKVYAGQTDIWSVCWSPDNNRVAGNSLDSNSTAFTNYEASVWDCQTGKKLGFFHSWPLFCYSMCWDSQSRRLVSYYFCNDRLITRDIYSGRTENIIINKKSIITQVALSPSDRILASSRSPYYVTLYNYDTGAMMYEFERASAIDFINWSPDGLTIAINGPGFTISIWDVLNNKEAKALGQHQHYVTNALWNDDGTKIASICANDTVKIWDTENGRLLYNILVEGFSGGYSWSPDGTLLAIGCGDSTVKFFSVVTGEFIRSSQKYKRGIKLVEWNPKGKYIALTLADDNRIFLWDWQSGVDDDTLIGHEDDLHLIKWSPDGTKLASSSNDLSVIVWNVNIGSNYDVSDSLWSIVSPKLQSLDVNMGKVLVGTGKDSVIQELVINKGTFRSHTDSIYFEGADRDKFSLVSGFPPFDVAPGEPHRVEIRFTPVTAGINNAVIVILADNDTLRQSITGEGIVPVVNVGTKIVDFGQVKVLSHRDTAVALIENLSSAPVTVNSLELSGAGKRHFAIIDNQPFTLNSNEQKAIRLRFQPLSVGGTYSMLEFHYTGDASPAVTQLYGTGEGVLVYIAGDSAYVSEQKQLKLICNFENTELLPTVADSINAKIRFQKTILAPASGNIPFTIEDDSTFIVVSTKVTNNNLIAEIPLIAGLGTVTETTVDIVTLRFIDSKGETVNLTDESRSGLFRLLGICREGGARLVNPEGQVSIVSIVPNPVQESVSITLNLVEKGPTTLHLSDLLGRVQICLYEDCNSSYGTKTINASLEGLPAGVYYITLRTPTVLQTMKLMKN